MYHVLVSDGLTFLCMAEEVRQRVRACGVRPSQPPTTAVWVAASSQEASPAVCTCASCGALQAAGRRVPFALLDDIKGRFTSSYGRAQDVSRAWLAAAGWARHVQL